MVSPTRLDRDEAQPMQHQTNIMRMNINSSSLQIDENTVLKGITFAPAASGTLCTASWQLRHLSIVDTARIPFSFIAGPSQDVWTDDEVTITWFSDQLGEVSNSAGLGILAEVRNAHESHEKGSLFREVLFFVESTDAAQEQGLDASPITLKAIPLNSAVPSYLPSPPQSPVNVADECDAQLLPPLEQLQATALANERKRKQVSDVFDEATERRRRAKRHGGESVAAAAGAVNVLVGQKRPKAPVKAQTPASAKAAASSRPHSRTASFSAAQTEPPRRPLSRSPSMSSDIRPVSRKGIVEATTMSKRSSLSRVSSLADTATIEERNKDAISRLVMAGMRLYGLQQRKRSGHARRASEVNGQAQSGADGADQDAKAKDEEYKLIYHQTYKGTVFAFRRAIVRETLYSQPEVLQETVDMLLAVFCSDPLEPV